MIRRKLVIPVIVISISIVFAGCSQPTETVSVKNSNSNQPTVVSNINSANTVANVSNSAQINSNIAVNQPTSNNNKAPISKMPESPAKIGSGGNDMATLMQVRTKLSADKELINSVIVEVKEGNATLTGKVSSDEQKKNAEQIVKNVEGVKSVKNNLTVAK